MYRRVPRPRLGPRRGRLSLLALVALPVLAVLAGACGDDGEGAESSADGLQAGGDCVEYQREVSLSGALTLPEGIEGVPEGTFIESVSYRCGPGVEGTASVPGVAIASLRLDDALRFEQDLVVRFIGTVVPEIVLNVCLDGDGDGVLWTEGDIGGFVSLPAVDAEVNLTLEYEGCRHLL